jgi:hypothetical protein
MPRLSSPPLLLLVYAELKGPRGRTMLRLALDTGASYTMLPPEKLVTVGYTPPTWLPERLRFSLPAAQNGPR